MIIPFKGLARPNVIRQNNEIFRPQFNDFICIYFGSGATDFVGSIRLASALKVGSAVTNHHNRLRGFAPSKAERLALRDSCLLFAWPRCTRLFERGQFNGRDRADERHDSL